MVNRRSVVLTEGNIFRNVWYLAWPVVISYLLQTLVGIADVKMVGALGPESIAAVGLGRMALMVVIMVLTGISIGSSALVARYTGERSPGKVNRVVVQSLILVVGVSILITIIGIAFSKPILKLLGAEPEVMALGDTYVRIIFSGVIVLSLNFIINAVLQGAGDTRTPLVILAIINSLNILGNYLLIFGIGPFPELGVAGAAVASVSSRLLGTLIGFWVLFSGRFVIHLVGLNSLTSLTPNPSIIGKIIRIGVPASVQGLVRHGGILAITKLISLTKFSTYAISALTIGFYTESLSFMPGLAFSVAAATLVGQNLGARKPERAEESGWAATKIAASIMTAVGALLFIFAGFIVAKFSSDVHVVHIGTHYLRINAIPQPFLAMGMVLSGALRGAGDSQTPLKVSVLTTWGMRVPLAYVLAIALHYQTDGIWVAMALSMVAFAILIGIKFHQGKWKKIEL